MAQKSTRPQPPKDPYAQRTKQLTSAAQRLRGWVSSDASREPELADALVALNAHRLLGHGYAAAAADAQEAARRSTQLLTANGPIGPYTAITDATRYVAAVVHFAQIQIALGAPDAAGRTLDALDPLRSQLPALDEHLDPATAIWALLGRARALLAADDIATANAYADAALDRLAESGLAAEPDAVYLVLDVERLAADARWRAGRPAEALAHLHAAKDRYDRFLDDRLAQPGRLAPALLERLAEPLPGVHGDLADRLNAVGETELGLVLRRDLVDRLRAVAVRLPEPTTARLVQASTDLADDLRSVGREAEADAVVAELAGSTAALGRVRPSIGPAVSWSPLDRVTAYAVTTAGSAGAMAEPAREAERERETAAWLEAQRAEAHRLEEQRLEQARRAAAQAEAERIAAARAEAEQRAVEEARAADEARRRAERQAAEEEAEQAERKRRREERLAEYAAEQERAERERIAAEAAEEREARVEETEDAERDELERLAAELTAFERAEAERAEAARRDREDLHEERDEADRRETEQLEADRAEAARIAAEQAEAARVASDEAEAEALAADEAEAARRATEQVEAARIAAEQTEAERAAARQDSADRLAAEEAAAEDALAEQATQQRAELERAQEEFLRARTSGDRRSLRTAGDRLVELLRPRVETDLQTYGPILQATLEDLTGARLRGGDLFGSRAAAREARDIGRRLAGSS